MNIFRALRSLWLIKDNDSMDITQIESAVIPFEDHPLVSQANQLGYDYSNIISLLDYVKVKKPAY